MSRVAASQAWRTEGCPVRREHAPVDKSVQHTFASLAIETEQSGCLRERQAKAWHFPELSADTGLQVVFLVAGGSILGSIGR
jgi:hypothetical protein